MDRGIYHGSLRRTLLLATCMNAIFVGNNTHADILAWVMSISITLDVSLTCVVLAKDLFITTAVWCGIKKFVLCLKSNKCFLSAVTASETAFHKSDCECENSRQRNSLKIKLHTLKSSYIGLGYRTF